MADFSKGDAVTWDWGKGTAEGKIAEVFHDRVEREIKGKTITRNATKDEPAYLIRQADEGEVLKSASEISKA